MSVSSPELSAKVQYWRQLAAAGTLTIEQQREAIAALRAARGSVPQAQAGSAKTKAAAKAKPDGNALLDELEGL